MEYNVEQIYPINIKARATFEDGCVKVVNKYGGEIKYDSIQVFANHWRFIEDKPKELLKPAVITFIKHYLALNGIKLDQVESISFYKYSGWAECYIDGSFDSPANSFELNKGLIDFDLIEKDKDYTLEELGIK